MNDFTFISLSLLIQTHFTNQMASCEVHVDLKIADFSFSVCFINHFRISDIYICLALSGCGGTTGHPLDLWLGRGHKWTFPLGSLTAWLPSRLPVVGTGGAGRGGSLRPGRMGTLEGKFCDAHPGFYWCICCCLFLRFLFLMWTMFNL